MPEPTERKTGDRVALVKATLAFLDAFQAKKRTIAAPNLLGDVRRLCALTEAIRRADEAAERLLEFRAALTIPDAEAERLARRCADWAAAEDQEVEEQEAAGDDEGADLYRAAAADYRAIARRLSGDAP